MVVELSSQVGVLEFHHFNIREYDEIQMFLSIWMVTW